MQQSVCRSNEARNVSMVTPVRDQHHIIGYWVQRQ